jgi:deazaflavin-dependent oxidoreductase (nitroreductase family)
MTPPIALRNYERIRNLSYDPCKLSPTPRPPLSRATPHTLMTQRRGVSNLIPCEPEGARMSETNDYTARNSEVIAEFRANVGQVDGFDEPLLLLTSIGAKSGKPRINPLIYHTDGDRLIVFAAHGGAPTHPDWYHNVVAHPEVTVEVGDESWAATAEVAVGQERDRLWADSTAKSYPFLVELQAKITRQIPVVILQRRQ